MGTCSQCLLKFIYNAYIYVTINAYIYNVLVCVYVYIHNYIYNYIYVIITEGEKDLASIGSLRK